MDAVACIDIFGTVTGKHTMYNEVAGTLAMNEDAAADEHVKAARCIYWKQLHAYTATAKFHVQVMDTSCMNAAAVVNGMDVLVGIHVMNAVAGTHHGYHCKYKYISWRQFQLSEAVAGIQDIDTVADIHVMDCYCRYT